MHISNKHLKLILEKYRRIVLLGQVDAVLGWDLNVNLPQKGAEGRAGQSALMAEMLTESWLEPELEKLLRQAEETQQKLLPEEKAILRNLEREGRFYRKVPKEIIIEKAKSVSRAFMAWQAAKSANQAGEFFPHLKKLVELDRVIAEHLGYKDNPYNALLDLFEPGLTAGACHEMFASLEKELVPLITRIKSSPRYDEEELAGERFSYPLDEQKRLALYVLKRMNYDLMAGRMDTSAHPFTTQLGRFDIRITNWYKNYDFRDSLMAAMHEGGHGLYEQGVNPDFDLTPLGGGVSLSIHESQSRFWENQVGRNPRFIEFITPLLQAFYNELSTTGSERIAKSLNRVKPGLIRTEADEVTYNLHIILRFEIENGLINGKIAVEDLPEVWREKMKQLLGIVPPTDREGILQDVHWSHGSFGYFPTYTLGNLYAAQFAARMRKELPVDDALGRGELGTILLWLRENVHQYGSLYWPDELIKKVTGESLHPAYFTGYLKEKYGSIYGLTA